MIAEPGWGLAFIAGLLSFFSPCVAPLAPVYLAYITGLSTQGGVAVAQRPGIAHVMGHCLLFVLGFTFIFVLLGSSISFVASFFQEQRQLLYQVAGGGMVVMGLLVSGLLRPSFLAREWRLQLDTSSLGPAGPTLFGMAFALGWTPCVGPILASILLYAGAAETAGRGGLLLLVYSLGFGIPFIIGAIAWTYGLRLFSGLGRYYGILNIVAGALIALMGVLLLTGQWYRLNIWAQKLYYKLF